MVLIIYWDSDCGLTSLLANLSFTKTAFSMRCFLILATVFLTISLLKSIVSRLLTKESTTLGWQFYPSAIHPMTSQNYSNFYWHRFRFHRFLSIFQDFWNLFTWVLSPNRHSWDTRIPTQQGHHDFENDTISLKGPHLDSCHCRQLWRMTEIARPYLTKAHSGLFLTSD